MYQSYLTRLAQLVPSQADVLTAADHAAALSAAIAQYSCDLPRIKVADVQWPEAGCLGPLPPNWGNFSYLVSAEYPLGQQPAQLIDIAPYVTPNGVQLMSLHALPSGAVVRLTYKTEHVLTDIDSSLPAQHSEPVCSFAASVLCTQLAVHFSGQRESSIGADASHTDGRVRNYALRAADYRAAYYAGIGQVDPRLAKTASGDGAAGSGLAAVVQWPRRTRFLKANI